MVDSREAAAYSVLYLESSAMPDDTPTFRNLAEFRQQFPQSQFNMIDPCRLGMIALQSGFDTEFAAMLDRLSIAYTLCLYQGRQVYACRISA